MINNNTKEEVVIKRRVGRPSIDPETLKINCKENHRAWVLANRERQNKYVAKWLNEYYKKPEVKEARALYYKEYYLKKKEEKMLKMGNPIVC